MKLMSFFKSTIFFILIAIILLIVFFSLGFLVGRSSFKVPEITKAPRLAVVDNQIFSKQTAEIKGQILDTKDDTITVQNESGIKADFAALSQIYVTEYTNKGKVSGFKSLDKLEKNKKVLINLEMNPQDSFDKLTYRVIALTILPSLPVNQTP